ncbi:MAG: hypothetical protein VKK62_01950, partial [Synechococcaceae cyanobacterium]|nr:hypothetical protein [Synechococcaceae cyanobacterium]
MLSGTSTGALSQTWPAPAERQAAGLSPSTPCRPLGSTPSQRDSRVAVPRLRVGDTIHYISYGEAIDSLASAISYGEAGDSLIPRSNGGGQGQTSSDGRNKVKVMANGAIFMPKGGLVRVAGMTLPQAEKAMKAA